MQTAAEEAVIAQLKSMAESLSKIQEALEAIARHSRIACC
jgi:hypothetical protein